MCLETQVFIVFLSATILVKRFLQTHKTGNLDITANFVFACICSFLHYYIMWC